MLINTIPLVSGFTFIKNGISLGYPLIESIKSIDPLCDEVVINVGFDDEDLSKDDGTYQLLRDTFSSDRYKFLKSFWNPTTVRSGGGRILSEQTNIALAECRGKFCQYIQSDEAVHEYDLPNIESAMELLASRKDIDSLIYNYLHFYGNVDIYKHTRNIYRREARTIRNGVGIESWLDAQGFRYRGGKKVRGKLIDARIFHYGWARQEMIMNKKIKVMDGLYHQESYEIDPHFKYQRIWGLRSFNKTHPKVMENWIKQHKNSVDIMNLHLRFELKNIGLMISDFIENKTDYRIGEYRNFQLVD